MVRNCLILVVVSSPVAQNEVDKPNLQCSVAIFIALSPHWALSSHFLAIIHLHFAAKLQKINENAAGLVRDNSL